MSRYTPGQRLDSYRIEELLGTGAYAETYKATDTRDGKTVVLKIPDQKLFADPNTFRRYRREAEVASRLSHPGVQGAIDSGEARSEQYLVLDFVDGVPLRKKMRSYGAHVPIPTVVDWGRHLAEGLAYLHSKGVVHRDLKPENILVTPDGRLVIGDFGTAALAGARRLTWRHLAESLGTPDYMSPEQVQGDRGDARSDIYAWGVMMYELLTGRVPFDGDNWMAVMAGHLRGDPKPIRKLRPDVPPALEAVVTHAMRRFPAHRYPSAPALLADLNRLDQLDPAAYDTSPEPAMGGMAAEESSRRLFKLAALIAVGFIALCVLLVTLTLLLR
ncbi:MAG TPA: serine/threonine-protein kinase [Acidimicrobiales bacterium]|nr:serine/threonine-protein kinase [Acidimicrobiales bacterium]